MLNDLDSEATVWRRFPLTYEQPRVPEEFYDNGRANPSFLWGTLYEDTFENGSHLFQKQHRRGWMHFRSDFYESYSENLGPRKLDLNGYKQLSKTEWTNEHWRYPYDLGYAECVKQIDQLLENHTEDDLRRSIGYPRYWHTFAYLVMLFLSCTAMVYMKPKTSG